jgi:hypothetical protein
MEEDGFGGGQVELEGGRVLKRRGLWNRWMKKKGGWGGFSTSSNLEGLVDDDYVDMMVIMAISGLQAKLPLI